MSFFTVPGLHILCSKCEGGKSTLIKFELYKGAQKKTYDYAIIFSGSPDDGWERIIDVSYVYYNYSESILAKIMKFQKEQMEGDKPAKLLLIFDDIVGSINFNSNLFSILMTRYRHFNIGIVLSTQYIYSIPPTIREQSSKSMIFYQETKRSIMACYETWGQSFDNYKAFRSYLNANTQDHQFITVYGKNSGLTGKYEIKKIDINTIPKDTIIEF